jgi:hypothetical protein
MPTTEALILSPRWRVLYSVALLIGFVTAGFGRAGWPQIITDPYRPQFSIPSAIVLVLILGRLVTVWARAELLTWPTTTGLRKLAKLSLAAAVIAGITVGIAFVGSTFYIKTVPGDARGAVGLIIGFALLPLMLPASVGVVLFEWTRGMSAAKSSLKTDRALLTIAAVVGALIVISIAVSRVLFPMDSLTRAQYDGSLPWILFALGLGALIVNAQRGDAFPGSAVFSTTLTTYLVATIAMILPPLSLMTRGSVGQLIEGKGLIGNGAAFALVLAVVPAVALAILNRLGRGRSASVAMRTVAAGVVAVPTAWLGIALGTKALNPPKYMRDSVLSDEQLSGQAVRLQSRCAEAGIQVFRTQQGVSEIEIRYPNEPPGSKRAVELFVHPDASRPHHWFPTKAEHRWYERVVFAVNGKRRGYRPDASQAFGYGSVDSTDYFPRYVLTWNSLQTSQEEAEGILGTEMTIFDTQDDSVLARQVLFFRRNNERYGLFQEACGTLKRDPLVDAYAYKWASTILIPKGAPGAP